MCVHACGGISRVYVECVHLSYSLKKHLDQAAQQELALAVTQAIKVGTKMISIKKTLRNIYHRVLEEALNQGFCLRR